MLSCHCQIAGQRYCSCDCSYCPFSSSASWPGSEELAHWEHDPASSVEEWRRRALRCLTTVLNTAYERREGDATALGGRLAACDPCCRQMPNQHCYSYCFEMIDCACCFDQRPSDVYHRRCDASWTPPFTFRSLMAEVATGR